MEKSEEISYRNMNLLENTYVNTKREKERKDKCFQIRIKKCSLVFLLYSPIQAKSSSSLFESFK